MGCTRGTGWRRRKERKKKKHYRRVNQILLFINGVLAHPEARALDDGHGARHLAGPAPARKLAHALELGLDAEDGLADARGPDRLAVVGGRQAAHGPLAHAVRGVDARRVGGLEEVLRDDVEGALARRVQVVQRVLGLGGGAQAGGEANDKQGRVVVDDLEVAEGGQVGRGAVGGHGRDEGDGAGHDGRDEELVVVDGGAAVGVGVDGDVFRAGRAGGEVVGAGARRPRGRGRLGILEGGVAVPVGAGGLDLLEVRVRVALDLGFLHGEGRGRGQEAAGVVSRGSRRQEAPCCCVKSQSHDVRPCNVRTERCPAEDPSARVMMQWLSSALRSTR